jgi:hypothetical protein
MPKPEQKKIMPKPKRRAMPKTEQKRLCHNQKEGLCQNQSQKDDNAKTRAQCYENF